MAITLGVATSVQPKSLDKAKLDPIGLEESIRRWCGLFVFINHSRIYLIHQTAKEFLICDSVSTAPSSVWKHCLNPREIEKDMTRVCVEFLCFEDVRPTAQSLVKRFVPYRDIDDILDKNNYVESLLAY